MKKRFYVKLLTVAALATALNIGCAQQQQKEGGSASKASAEATAAINDAKAALDIANANHWVWRDTAKFLKQAQEAADKGDDATAIKLANKAKFQAEAAVIQYNYEKGHPRAL